MATLEVPSLWTSQSKRDVSVNDQRYGSSSIIVYAEDVISVGFGMYHRHDKCLLRWRVVEFLNRCISRIADEGGVFWLQIQSEVSVWRVWLVVQKKVFDLGGQMTDFANMSWTNRRNIGNSRIISKSHSYSSEFYIPTSSVCPQNETTSYTSTIQLQFRRVLVISLLNILSQWHARQPQV